MAYIENIVIGIPIYPCGELLSNGSRVDMFREMRKTHFTNCPNIARILKDVGVVKSISEVRRNKPSLATDLNADFVDCFWIKWGKRKLFVIKGPIVSDAKYKKWREG